MKKNTKNFSFPTPRVCAWCGSLNPIRTIMVTSQQQKMTGFYLVAYTTNTTTTKIPLPVCEECSAHLNKTYKLQKVTQIIGGLLGALIGFLIACMDWFMGFVPQFPIIEAVLYAVIGFFFGVMLFSWIAPYLFKQKEWGRIVNGKYDFYNDQFRNAFIKLRDQLIREQEENERLSAQNG